LGSGTDDGLGRPSFEPTAQPAGELARDHFFATLGSQGRLVDPGGAGSLAGATVPAAALGASLRRLAESGAAWTPSADIRLGAIDAVLGDELDSCEASDKGFVREGDLPPCDEQRDIALSLDDAASEAERDPTSGDEVPLDFNQYGQPAGSTGARGFDGEKAAFGLATLAFAVCAGRGFEQPGSRTQERRKQALGTKALTPMRQYAK
jgi:hypothetical protein